MNPPTNPGFVVPPAAVCKEVRCDAVLVPLLAGSMLSCVLLGVLCILAIAAFWGRSRSTKTTILLVLSLQFAQTLTDTLRTTLKYALHYGDLAYWIRTTPDDALAIFFGVLLQAQAQAFMLGRACKYAGLGFPVPRGVKVAIAGVVGVVIVGSMVCGCAVAVLTKTLGSYEKLVPSATGSPRYTILVHCWLISSAILDSVLAASITHELVRARKWSSDRSTNAAWVRAIARKMVIVVIQSGFLLATVQTITLVLWRVEMKTPTTRGTAYVFFPITVLPKLYTITYLVIRLCTPPPGVAQAATASGTSGQPWITTSPSHPDTPTSDRKETVVEVPASATQASFQLNLLPQALTVRPDWISLEQTQPQERTARSRSWSDSTAVADSLGSPTTRSAVRGRLGSEDTLASGSPSPKHTPPKIRVDNVLAPIGEVDVELEYYRSYAAALEASRTPRTATFEQSPSVSIFPMIEHPYVASVSDRVVKEIEVPVVLGFEEGEPGEGDLAWDDTPTVKSAAPTVSHFDADECLAKYKFGTHKDDIHLEVPLADKAEQLRIKHEFAQHARNFMRPSVCSAAGSDYQGEGGETLEDGEGDALEVPPKLARLESDASFVCAREAKRMSSGRMVY